MEKTVRQRLISFIEYCGLDNAKFERACGLGNGYVNKLKSEPGSKKLEDILIAFPDLNRKWLLYGEGNMVNQTTHGSAATPMQAARVARARVARQMALNRQGTHECNMPAVIEVKENGVEVECPKCGEVIEVPGSTVLAMVPKEITKKPDIDLEKWRRKHPQQMKKIDFSEIWGDDPFVVQVDTRAMEPDYREGTFLVLQPLPDISYATADGIAYVIDTMKPHTLFRNLTDKYDGTYLLTSNSDKRSSIRLKAEDIITVYDIVGTFRMGR